MGPRARRRRWPLWLLLGAALLGAALFALRAALQPERLGALLLRQAGASSGLQLQTTSPARLGLWPDLHLELDGLVARGANGAVLLQAERVEAVLPWSALRGDALALRSLRLHAPVLDLAALDAWRAPRADEGPPAPLELPWFDGALALDAGRVLGNGWQLQAIRLALPQWRPGTPTQLQLDATLALDGGDTWRLELAAGTLPQAGLEPLRLDPLQLALHLPGERTAPLQLDGWLQWAASRLQFALEGSPDPWPANWPRPPLPGDDAEPARLRIVADSDSDLRGTATLWLARGDGRVEARLQSGGLGDWLAGRDAAWLPPLRGGIEANRLQFEGTTLHGVKIRITDDEAGTDAQPD